METGERLSAYLAGELDADETAALEAELAGDPTLRARLDAIGRANDALASLPEVEPPADFSRRLRETLSHEIAQRGASPQVDELAHRRLQRRAGSNRSLGLGLAAAAVLVLGAVGLAGVLDGIGGGDDSADTVALRGGDRAEMGATAEDPLAAYVRVSDTDYDAETVQALAEQEGVLDVPERVDDEQARALESERYEAFGLLSDGAALSAPLDAASGEGDPPAEPDEAPPQAADTDGAATGGGTGTDGDISEETTRSSDDPLTDVRRCLPEIVASANQPVIPLFAEVARYEGEPAIIYLVLTREPDARLFNRIEAWVVGREDCFPVLFQQLAH